VAAGQAKSVKTADCRQVRTNRLALFCTASSSYTEHAVPHTYRHSGQTTVAVSISFECFGMENTYLLERVGDKPPVWDQRFK